MTLLEKQVSKNKQANEQNTSTYMGEWKGRETELYQLTMELGTSFYKSTTNIMNVDRRNIQAAGQKR